MPDPLGAGDEDELAALDDQIHAAQDGRPGPVRLVDVLEHQDRAVGGVAREALAGSEERAKSPAEALIGGLLGVLGLGGHANDSHGRRWRERRDGPCHPRNRRPATSYNFSACVAW